MMSHHRHKKNEPSLGVDHERSLALFQMPLILTGEETNQATGFSIADMEDRLRSADPSVVRTVLEPVLTFIVGSSVDTDEAPLFEIFEKTSFLKVCRLMAKKMQDPLASADPWLLRMVRKHHMNIGIFTDYVENTRLKTHALACEILHLIQNNYPQYDERVSHPQVSTHDGVGIEEVIDTYQETERCPSGDDSVSFYGRLEDALRETELKEKRQRKEEESHLERLNSALAHYRLVLDYAVDGTSLYLYRRDEESKNRTLVLGGEGAWDNSEPPQFLYQPVKLPMTVSLESVLEVALERHAVDRVIIYPKPVPAWYPPEHYGEVIVAHLDTVGIEGSMTYLLYDRPLPGGKPYTEKRKWIEAPEGLASYHVIYDNYRLLTVEQAKNLYGLDPGKLTEERLSRIPVKLLTTAEERRYGLRNTVTAKLPDDYLDGFVESVRDDSMNWRLSSKGVGDDLDF